MDTAYRTIRIQYLKAELELRRLTSESLAHKFERKPLTGEQRTELLECWEEMLHESHKLQVMLDLLEGDEKEAALSGKLDSLTWDSQQFTSFIDLYRAKDKTPTS